MAKHEYRRVKISCPGPGGEIFYKFTDGRAVEMVFMTREIYGLNPDVESDEGRAMLQALYKLKPFTAAHKGVEFTLTPSICSACEYETEIFKLVLLSRMRKAKAARAAA